MNSAERHAARRARRDAKRAINKMRRCENLTLETIADIDNLYRAARESIRGVDWKYSVQYYERNIFSNIYYARGQLLNGKDFRKPLSYFYVMERGKIRYISAPRISERVIQKSISQNVLVPAVAPTLTQGCCANIKGRGTDYCLIRLKKQLAEYCQENGSDGYILLMDFSDYFGSIDHDAAKALVDKVLVDERVKQIMYLQIDRGEDEKGLGLGSEPNQAIAVALPSPIDYLGERWSGIVYSGRYMDDSYYISRRKDVLQEFLKKARNVCASLGITINEKKTHIIKLSRGFTFLKKRFRFNQTGKIIVTPARKSIGRMRRKMKKLAEFVRRGEMTVEQARQSYFSFRGALVKRKGDGKTRFRQNVYHTVKKLDLTFYELFGEYPIVKG